MKNKFCKILLLICIISLICISCSKNSVQTIDDDVIVTGTLINVNLDGHTVFIEEGSTSFENISNGRIYIQENNKANTVVFKNCQNLDVIVFSKSNLVLDSYTTINRLELNGNARVTHLHNSKKKNQFPVIQKVIIAAGINPVLEDCNFMSFELKENPVKKEEVASSKSSEKITEEKSDVKSVAKMELPAKKQESTEPEVKKLTLVQDKNYDGNGVKILISNVPEKAVVLTVFLTDDNGKIKQISFMKNTRYGENHEYFDLGYFIYPFLAAGRSYTLDFIYKLTDSSDDYIEKASIKIVPDKGEELFIKSMDKDNFVINPETLTGYFKEKLISNIPQNASITVSVWDLNWTFLGNTTRTLSEKNAYGPYDLYLCQKRFKFHNRCSCTFFH